MLCARIATVVLIVILAAPAGFAREMPKEYAAVFSTLGKKGDFKDAVLKVNIPRNDLNVTIGKRSAPTPFGFGGWVAFTNASDGADVMMGDLVLTEDEVNPVMSAIFLHYYGTGPAAKLAQGVRGAVDVLGKPAGSHLP